MKSLFLILLPLTLLFAQEEGKTDLYISNSIIVKSLTGKTAQKDSVEKFQLPEKHSDEIEYIKERLDKIHEVRIITVMDEEYRGNLLYTSDSLLVICEGNGCYEWRTESVQSFSYSDIKKIVVIIEGKGRKGLMWGIAIGFLAGIQSSDPNDIRCPDSGLGCRVSEGAALGILFAIPGAIYGGLIGLLMGRDSNYLIDESINEFQNALPILKKESIFPSNPAL
ncbi:hypothetical protein E3V55_02760 [Candidatus Marinimicrobia bacterium MT.SAG.3]|nr:hypothetical protein E3V55_02760 [Candidatus Marinimicrobia bacterium MT.SAG.3]